MNQLLPQSLSPLIQQIQLSRCDHENHPPCRGFIQQSYKKFSELLGLSELHFQATALSNFGDSASKLVLENQPGSSSFQQLINEENSPLTRVISESAVNKKNYVSWQEAIKYCLVHPKGQNSEEKAAYRDSIKQLDYAFIKNGFVEAGMIADEVEGYKYTCTFATNNAFTISDEVWRTIKLSALIVTRLLKDTLNCAQCTGCEVPKVKLTKAEKHTLHTILAEPQFSLQGVADKMKKSPNTINTHLKSIRRKLSMPRMSGGKLAAYCKERQLI